MVWEGAVMGLPLGAAARVLGGGSVLPHATFPSEDDAVAADVLGAARTAAA